jgi:hypothetical protein
MKRIWEVLDLTGGIGKDDKMDVKGLSEPIHKDATHLSTMPSGHKIYHRVFNDNDGTKYHHYYVDGGDGKTAVKLETNQGKNHKAEEIDKIAADRSYEKRPKAHEVYHHLITHHDKMFTSYAQSAGGKGAWKKLSGMKNVNVHGWDAEKEKPVNIDLKSDDYEHEIFASHADLRRSREEGGGVKNKEHQGIKDVLNMHIVAHRKTKPKNAMENKKLLGDILSEAYKKRKKACCSACAASVEGKEMHEEVEDIMEAEYQGKTVTLNKPFRTSGARKKFGVYTMGPNGNVVMVRFGDPNLSIKRDNPERRKNFRARHKCDSDRGPKWKARYWSCHQWRAGAKVED